MTRLDDLIGPWSEDEPMGDKWFGENLKVREAIREAYRMGHDDGRNARIRQDEQTFIGALREKQDAAE